MLDLPETNFFLVLILKWELIEFSKLIKLIYIFLVKFNKTFHIAQLETLLQKMKALWHSGFLHLPLIPNVIFLMCYNSFFSEIQLLNWFRKTPF